jgi:hypothetical protein
MLVNTPVIRMFVNFVSELGKVCGQFWGYQQEVYLASKHSNLNIRNDLGSLGHQENL